MPFRGGSGARADADPRFAAGHGVAGTPTLLGIDLAGRLLSESAGGEAAGSGGSDLQVIAAFPEPVEDFTVAGGKGHVEVGSRFRGGQVQDGVDQPGSSSDGQVAGLYVEVGVDCWAVGSGADGGFGQDVVVVGQGEVLRCAGHVRFLPGSLLYDGWTAANKLHFHVGKGGALSQPLVVMETSLSWFLGEAGNFVAAQL
jgi:hypothetical protein